MNLRVLTLLVAGAAGTLLALQHAQAGNRYPTPSPAVATTASVGTAFIEDTKTTAYATLPTPQRMASR